MKKIILTLMLITGLAIFAKAQDSTRVKRSPEQRAAYQTKALQKKLNLTADQTRQVSAILLANDKKIDGLPKGKAGAMARLEVLTDTDNRIKLILNDDQKKTYTETKQAMMEHMKKMRNARKNNIDPAG
jgi:hypothetical protein